MIPEEQKGYLGEKKEVKLTTENKTFRMVVDTRAKDDAGEAMDETEHIITEIQAGFFFRTE